MADLCVFEPGGYRFIKAVFQYSGGVAAMPGHRIVRVVLPEPVALNAGFDMVENVLREAGRPLTAFCACELRSPAPFTEGGFRKFNEIYAGRLEQWGIYTNVNPVARSNVCPAVDPPDEPSLHAFAYTERHERAEASFIVAGSAEAPEGMPNYRDHIVRRGELTADALREKARFVLGAMEARLAALGFAWRDVTATQTYTVHDVHSFFRDEIVLRGAARHGLTWHHCRPPVVDLEFEMDCRRVLIERVLAA